MMRYFPVVNCRPEIEKRLEVFDHLLYWCVVCIRHVDKHLSVIKGLGFLLTFLKSCVNRSTDTCNFFVLVHVLVLREPAYFAVKFTHQLLEFDLLILHLGDKSFFFFFKISLLFLDSLKCVLRRSVNSPFLIKVVFIFKLKMEFV